MVVRRLTIIHLQFLLLFLFLFFFFSSLSADLFLAPPTHWRSICLADRNPCSSITLPLPPTAASHHNLCKKVHLRPATFLMTCFMNIGVCCCSGLSTNTSIFLFLFNLQCQSSERRCPLGASAEVFHRNVRGDKKECTQKTGGYHQGRGRGRRFTARFFFPPLSTLAEGKTGSLVATAAINTTQELN